MKKWLIAFFALAFCGCGGEKDTPSNPPAAGEVEKSPPVEMTEKTDAKPHAGEKIVEDVTGITALKSGRKAQDQIKQINADYNRKLEKALEDN